MAAKGEDKKKAPGDGAIRAVPGRLVEERLHRAHEDREILHRLGAAADNPLLVRVDTTIAVLEELIDESLDTGNALTPAEATAYSGYSRQQLWRQANDGLIKNVGRPNKPRYLESSLDVKPGHTPPQERPEAAEPDSVKPSSGFDPGEAARRMLRRAG